MGSKKMEYRTLEATFEDLEEELNRVAQDGFKAIQFLEGPDSKVRVVLARKNKKPKHYEEIEEDEIY